MWPAKLPGEGWSLYQACEAMCQVMQSLGVAVDGGKDSLSMAARVSGGSQDKNRAGVVKAPGSLVVSAYAPCPDITKVSQLCIYCLVLGPILFEMNFCIQMPNYCTIELYGEWDKIVCSH